MMRILFTRYPLFKSFLANDDYDNDFSSYNKMRLKIAKFDLY